jgi:hypothetical protein
VDLGLGRDLVDDAGTCRAVTREVARGLIAFDLHIPLSPLIKFHYYTAAYGTIQRRVPCVDPAVDDRDAYSSARASPPGPFPRDSRQRSIDGDVAKLRLRKRSGPGGL